MDRRAFFRLLPAVPVVTVASVASAGAPPKIAPVDLPRFVPMTTVSSASFNAKFQAIQDALNALIQRANQ